MDQSGRAEEGALLKMYLSELMSLQCPSSLAPVPEAVLASNQAIIQSIVIEGSTAAFQPKHSLVCPPDVCIPDPTFLSSFNEICANFQMGGTSYAYRCEPEPAEFCCSCLDQDESDVAAPADAKAGFSFPGCDGGIVVPSCPG